MPPRLNIPERYRAPLYSIRLLPDTDVQKIRAILDEVVSPSVQNPHLAQELPSDPGAAITAVRKASPKTGIANLTKLLDVLVALYEIKSQRDISVEEFVDDVCNAMENLDHPEYRLEHSDRADFAGKLLTLLNAEVFALVAKAHDLVTEDERTFCHARILTDLRPVFGSVAEDGPKAMIVMHTLKLAFHQQGSNDDHGEFYVSLDAEDLQTLQDVDRSSRGEGEITGCYKSEYSTFWCSPREGIMAECFGTAPARTAEWDRRYDTGFRLERGSRFKSLLAEVWQKPDEEDACPPRTSQEVENCFKRLADEWSRNTMHISSSSDLINDKSYRDIIDMGWDVVPYLLIDLQQNKRSWFPALAEITRLAPLRSKRQE